MKYVPQCSTKFGLLILTFVILLGVNTKGAQANKPMKIKKTTDWKEVEIMLTGKVASESESVSRNLPQTVKAKIAVYEIIPAPADDKNEFSVLMIEDPFSKRRIFAEGQGTFYVSSPEGLKSYIVWRGSLESAGSLVELKAKGNEGADIEMFENKLNIDNLVKSWKRQRKERLEFSQAFPEFYFSDSPAPGGRAAYPIVDGVEVIGEAMRIRMHNPFTKVPAELSLNVKEMKVLKCVVDGKEMDLSAIGTTRTYTVPLNK